jgi:pimeloyl-ACP methyl ester carboxylesterase
MKKLLNISIPNKTHNILADVYYKEQNKGDLVLFCHGFKGFKDWGAWHLVAEAFADAGFIFVKFNFSHNGIGKEDLLNFSRLDLFKENNYSIEMDDVETVIDWVGSEKYGNLDLPEVVDIFVIGHSRGGGIALLSAFEHKKISKVATWASIANFDRFGTEENIEEWKQEGEKNFYNSRTLQDMKIGYQFYEDFDQNSSRFDLERTCKNLKKPLLIIHGKEDDAVGFSHAQRLKNWKPDAELILLENTNHVFGASHPYLENRIPDPLALATAHTIQAFTRRF